MNVIVRGQPRTCVFRTRLRSGVWSVTKDEAFYGDYLSRAAAVDGACAAARAVDALGGSARVLCGPRDQVIPHQDRRPRTIPQ